jgi:glycosyltransferase involved in cell wall biosynthesis
MESKPEPLRPSCSIAVLIPCYNEVLTIGNVVHDFAARLPEAQIYVYDNNSTDGTAAAAAAAGAIVRHEDQQGKGHVLRRMFRDIDSDLYVLVDGDDTYDAEHVISMINLALSGPYDLVNGVRVIEPQEGSSGPAYRSGHQIGNSILTGIVRLLFGSRINDMLSGYKVLSRRFVKSFPGLASGFDIETEIAVHALELSLPIADVPVTYRGRPEGSSSKLRTYRDGAHILLLIFDLLKQERPLFFFSLIGLILALGAVGFGVPVVVSYERTGVIENLSMAVAGIGLILLAFLSGVCGLVLDTVTRGRRETKMLWYLGIDAPPQLTEAENEQRADRLAAKGVDGHR